MNDELLCREFKSLSLVQEDCFLGGYIWARLLSSRMQSERCKNHYNHRTTSGQRAAEGQAHVFQLDLLFIAIPLVPNNISHAAAKRLFNYTETFCGSIFGLSICTYIDGLSGPMTKDEWDDLVF